MTLRLTDHSGQPIRAEDLVVKHEHALHVMVVDQGLEDYSHTHPVANADGTFTFTFTPRLDRPYRLWADFSLSDPSTEDGAAAAGHAHGQDMADHMAHGATGAVAAATYAAVDLPVGAGPVPAVAATPTLTANADGLRFALSLEQPLRAGEASRASLSVADAQGRPYTQLQPLMGAFGHMVGFNPGATTMMHVHPEGAEPTTPDARGGPALTFMVEPESAGPQRLFVQVRTNGREVAVPFNVVVNP
jgi:hypothetical protein